MQFWSTQPPTTHFELTSVLVAPMSTEGTSDVHATTTTKKELFRRGISLPSAGWFTTLWAWWKAEIFSNDLYPKMWLWRPTQDSDSEKKPQTGWILSGFILSKGWHVSCSFRAIWKNWFRKLRMSPIKKNVCKENRQLVCLRSFLLICASKSLLWHHCSDGTLSG